MAGFFKSLFSGRSSGAPAGSAKGAPAASEDYKGFTIRAEPFKAANGQFQVAGTIVKADGAEMREHSFIRADTFATLEDAASVTISKGRVMIDQQGEGVFRQ